MQADLVTSGDGRWSLEVGAPGKGSSTARVDLPLGVCADVVRCKFRKRTHQVEVQTSLSFAAAFSVAAGAGDVNALKSLYGTHIWLSFTSRIRE